MSENKQVSLSHHTMDPADLLPSMSMEVIVPSILVIAMFLMGALLMVLLLLGGSG